MRIPGEKKVPGGWASYIVWDRGEPGGRQAAIVSLEGAQLTVNAESNCVRATERPVVILRHSCPFCATLQSALVFATLAPNTGENFLHLRRMS